MTMTEQLSEDVTLVLNHVLRDEDRQYGVHAKDDRNARLAVRVAQAGFNNRPELAIVVSWVNTVLMWTARSRELTQEEIRVHAAAQRVAEGLAMFDTIAQLGRAIEAQDWDEVRRRWEELTPYHALIVGACPIADQLNVVLHDRHALAKRSSARVH